MFTIKDKQMGVFREGALKTFEDEMVKHLKTFFPDHFAMIQEENIRNTIQYGYTKARRYGFGSIRNVCLYLNSMLFLGSNFDNDPMYPWAKSILSDTKNKKDSKVHIDKLADKVLETTGEIIGDKRIHLYRALLYLHKNSFDVYHMLTSNRHDSVYDHLHTVFPNKCEIIGHENIKELMRVGNVNAKRYRVMGPANIHLYLFFMFMLGSGFDTDPMMPWAGDILNDSKLDEGEKVKLLYDKAISYLNSFVSKQN